MQEHGLTFLQAIKQFSISSLYLGMQTQLPLFLKWGIQFGDAYEVPEQATRSVKYADRFELEQEIVRRRDAEDDEWEEPPMSDADGTRKGGQQQSQVQTAREHSSIPRRPPLRTD